MNFSISEAVKYGWEKMKANLWFFVIAFIIALVIQMIPNMFRPAGTPIYDQYGYQANVSAPTSPLFILVTIIFALIKMVVDMGFLKAALNINDNQKPELIELYKNYPLLLKYLAGSILFGLIVVVGFMLLIIPGIIFAVKLQYYSFLIVDKGMGPIAALKRSWEMTSGVGMRLFLFGVVLGLINVAGALALLIGLFVTVPTTLIASSFVYRKLVNR